jgi:predicted nucleic acid-binding protein
VLYRPHLEGHVIALSFIAIGKQYAGYRKKINKGDWPESYIEKLEARLRFVVIVPYDVDVCRTYGHLKAALKNPDGTHRVIAPNDLWIAACAVRHSLSLVTNNRRHFRDIPGLNIISEAPVVG